MNSNFAAKNDATISKLYRFIFRWKQIKTRMDFSAHITTLAHFHGHVIFTILRI